LDKEAPWGLEGKSNVRKSEAQPSMVREMIGEELNRTPATHP
jgi:hypothetical protein